MYLDWAHHDGSALHVEPGPYSLGDGVEVRLRMRHGVDPATVVLRTVHDGEPVAVEAKLDRRTQSEDWYVAELPIRNLRSRYRWLVSGGNVGYAWVNGVGIRDHDVTDANDFLLDVGPGIPKWATSSVAYQIFPDRFARSGRVQADLPDWAVPRSWDEHPNGRSPATPHEFYGGDLYGVAEHLDHIQGLGANLVYLTPFFPARSTHRYDSHSFGSVDPLLGGDQALAALADQIHARGMRLMGDLTLNHCGDGHAWFVQAQSAEAKERDWFTFDPALDHGYEAWWNIASLPKFNYRSETLQESLISGPDSVVRHWLKPPFSMDGWRIDVANMSGRQGSLDMTHDVSRLTRSAMLEENPDALLIAEHCHDATIDLVNGAWHGTMNYAGFLRPVWSWLNDGTFQGNFMGLPMTIPRFGEAQFIATVRSFLGQMSWESVLGSWNLLGSHDTPRVRTVVGSRDAHRAAVALLMTMPGTPMLFAGDEIGEVGEWGEDSRTPFPWEQRDRWDTDILDWYRTLIGVRITSHALQTGGFRWVSGGPDALAFVRESTDERLLVVVSRRSGSEVVVSRSDLGLTSVEALMGGDFTVDGDRLTLRSGVAGIWKML